MVKSLDEDDYKAPIGAVRHDPKDFETKSRRMNNNETGGKKKCYS
jgi:hypothetical protein